ncbi:hypothetical protein COO60DRAFT_588562 [Scenedesmus sp. NREL 46B-D3]|nr:hypothetical protein COO60DRAFT_588562 [Scenedesmus sp. NREL 46B-D3]
MALQMQRKAALSTRSAAPTRGLVVARYSQTLSAGDLAAFKIADLVEIGAKKGVNGGRNATRDSLTNAILRAGVAVSDLTKHQLSELKAKNPSAVSSGSAPSSGGRFSSYGSSSGSSTPSHSRSAGASAGGATLSAGDLSAFKIVDLVEIAAKKGVSPGRNATRQSVTSALVQAGVSVNDLTRGQMGDLGIKLGKAGLSRDINAARAELSALIGGSALPLPAGAPPLPLLPPATALPTTAAAPALPLLPWRCWRLWRQAERVRPGHPAHRRPARPGQEDWRRAAPRANQGRRDQRTDCQGRVCERVHTRHAGRPGHQAGCISGKGCRGLAQEPVQRGWRRQQRRRCQLALHPCSSDATSSGDRWSKYSAGSTQKASWRRSGSHNASGSKLSASDLAILRIDDLRDLVKKTGAELAREPTKDSVISALIQKNVSLNELTRGMLVDLANKLGQPLARDVDSLRKNLSSAVGKGGYSPAAPATSTSSWRTSTPHPPPAAATAGPATPAAVAATAPARAAATVRCMRLTCLPSRSTCWLTWPARRASLCATPPRTAWCVSCPGA